MITCTSFTIPVFEMITFKTTGPDPAFTSGGYTGCTREISIPSAIPEEMRTESDIGIDWSVDG